MPGSRDPLAFTVTSPDENLHAEIGSGYRVRLGFLPGTLRLYDEPTLEHQLAQLARLAWAEYLREQRALSDGSGYADDTSDPNRRRYREGLRRIEAAGTSAGEWVEAETVGLERWRFAIAAGATSRLDGDMLAAEIESAVASAVADYELRGVLLKDECFRFDLPPRIRRRFDEAWRSASSS
jgi:hypothetical protein